jgi:hypothetical protein
MRLDKRAAYAATATKPAAIIVTTLVVAHVRQTPQQACAAGARSTVRLSTGNARV